MAKENLYAVTYEGPLLPNPSGGLAQFIIPGERIDHKDDLTLTQGRPEVVSKTTFEKIEKVAQAHRVDSKFTFDDDYTEPAPRKRAKVEEKPIVEDAGINKQPESPQVVTDVVGDSEPPGERQAVEGSGIAEADTDSDR